VQFCAFDVLVEGSDDLRSQICSLAPIAIFILFNNL